MEKEIVPQYLIRKRQVMGKDRAAWTGTDKHGLAPTDMDRTDQPSPRLQRLRSPYQQSP